MLTPARVDSDPAYLQWVRDVASRHPMPPAMLRHALAAGLNNEAAEAELVLIRLCKMHMGQMCDQGRGAGRLFNTSILNSRQFPTLRQLGEKEHKGQQIERGASAIPPMVTRTRL